MMTRNARANIEKTLYGKLTEIRDLLDEIEPKHTLIGIALDRDYVSIQCYGETKRDSSKMLNFTRHEENGYVMRTTASGFEFIYDADMDATEREIWGVPEQSKVG